jgi:hypothetical protein
MLARTVKHSIDRFLLPALAGQSDSYLSRRLPGGSFPTTRFSWRRSAAACARFAAATTGTQAASGLPST